MAGIYLHIPFCKQACYYCDFHFSTQTDLKKQLVQAMQKEIVLQQDYLEKERIDTIYFGGGTPSLLSEAELNSLLNTIHLHHLVSSGAEITLEANPDDLNNKQLQAIKKAGVNRLSIGIQSFDDFVLKKLNRAHQAEQAVQAVRLAQDAGITNISIDLIHSIPDQNDAQLILNLEKAFVLKPTHISTYSLTIEEKTVFGRWNRSGKFNAMPEEQSARQFELVMDSLLEHGYEHYEISNYCLPGYYSRHNTSYWQQTKYLGIGPSAHSYNFVSRQHNVANNPSYIRAIETGVIPGEIELLSRQDKINEFIFTRLRTQWGVDPNQLLQQFGFDLQKEMALPLEKLLRLNLITVGTEDGIVRLTRQGKLMADQIAEDLFQ